MAVELNADMFSCIGSVQHGMNAIQFNMQKPTLYDMSIIRMNMLTLTGTGCNTTQEDRGTPRRPGANRGTGGPEAPEGTPGKRIVTTSACACN